MAGIDYTIPGQFKGIQIESPMNVMTQAMQLRSAQNQNALAQYQLGAAQRAETKDVNRMRLLGEAGDDDTAIGNALLKSGDIAGYAAHMKAVDNRKTQKLTQAKTTDDIVTTRLAQSREFLNTINPDEPDAEAKFSAWHEANHSDEYLGPLLASRGITAEQSRARIAAAAAQGPRAIAELINQSRLGIDKFTENQKAERAAAYEDYSLEEAVAGRVPVSQEKFFSRQRGGQTTPVAEPTAAPTPTPTPTPTAVQDGGELTQADLEAEFLSRRRDNQAAPAPAPIPTPAPVPAPAPGEDKMLPADVTTARRTGVEFLDPTAEQLYTLAAKTKDKDRSAALRAMADKIQAGFQKQIENQLPVFSQIDLKNETVITKRDPATGKTTIVDRFAAGISPADQERLKNESTRIKQENRRIQLDAQRVDLQTKRDALEAQKAARDADPAFQERMAAARAKGTETTKNQIKAQQILPSVISRGEEGIRLIDDLIGKAPVKDKNGRIIEEGTKPHPGFETAVGATWLPGSRFVPGTSAADFQARYEQLKGASFLEAFETLKGGGQITEKEGEQATAAINRMALAQSEAEFIAAGREVQKLLAKGIENAKTRVGVASAEQSSVRSEANAILGIP